MYEVEALPYALLIGMSEEQFWHSNPRKMRPYMELNKLKAKQQDELAWQHGAYVLEALLATVGNMFLKKGEQPNTYPKKPKLSDLDKSNKNEELSQDEIMKQTELLFASLNIMQNNFNLSHSEE